MSPSTSYAPSLPLFHRARASAPSAATRRCAASSPAAFAATPSQANARRALATFARAHTHTHMSPKPVRTRLHPRSPELRHLRRARIIVPCIPVDEIQRPQLLRPTLDPPNLESAADSPHTRRRRAIRRAPAARIALGPPWTGGPEPQPGPQARGPSPRNSRFILKRFPSLLRQLTQ